MRKLFVGGLTAAFLVFAATASYAGIGLSRHDITNATATAKYTFGTMARFGACSACHVPHGAAGDKLFPKVVGSGGGFYGPLCQLCHGNASGIPDPGGDLWVNNTVLGTGAHGLSTATLQASIANETVTTSQLPYADGSGPRGAGNIECTTCHDVHNSGKPPGTLPQVANRPFLWTSIDTLCQLCHSNYQNNSLTTVGTANNAGGVASTHPAGAVFTGNVSGGATPINTASNWGGMLVTNNITTGSLWATGSSWNSGFQLTGQGTTGGVSCPTCHNVHWDENITAGNLAVGNNGTAYLASVDDNLPGDSQDFCEWCHRGGPAGVATASGAGNYNNPGATAFTHPVDDVAAANSTITADLTWMAALGTKMGIVGTGASGLICTSCHGIHSSNATVATAKTTNNTPVLLRHGGAVAMNICSKCHQNAGFLHHPIGGSYATQGNSIGGLSCAGGDLAAGLGTCHGSTGGGVAHNRTSAFATPPTGAWGTDGAAYMCVKCHTVNPSIYTPDSSAYNANGSASHFVGDASAQTYAKGRTTATTLTAAIRQPSDGGAAWTSTLASIYQSGTNTNTILTCEGCHRLKQGNLRSGDSTYVGSDAAGTAMLVENVGKNIVCDTSDSVAQITDFTDAKYLCTGCHWVPVGTHPLAGVAAARMTTTYPIAATAKGETYVGGGSPTGLNCESCHSAHDAETTSGNFILDGTTAGGYGAGTGMAFEPTISYTTFCAVCHGTFQ